MPPDYSKMLKEADDREKGVRNVFNQYDIDKSGTIDQLEVTSVMEDLGLLKNLTTPSTTFVAEMFVKYDENDDGVLSFEEFKKFYNAAKDDAAGRKPSKQPTAVGRTVSGLDNNTQAQRRALKEEKARLKAEEAEKIRQENAALKQRLKDNAASGKDSKALDEEVLQKRREAAAARKSDNEKRKMEMQKQNKQMSQKIHNTASRTDHDLLDDVVGGKSVAEARDEKKKAGEEAARQRDKDAHERSKDLKKMKEQTGSRTDHDLSEEQNEVRDEKKKAGQEAVKQRDKEAHDRTKELHKMKEETGCRTDDKL